MITGKGIAARTSYYYINGTGILVDCGPGVIEWCAETKKKPKCIFITHGHTDHIYDLYRYMLCRPDTDVYVPRNIHGFVMNWLNSNTMLSTHGDQNICDFSKKIIPVGIGQCITVGKDIIVEAYETFHGYEPGNTLGYCISRTSKVLNSVYRGLNKEDLSKIPTSVKYTTRIVPIVLCTGDTNIKLFESEPILRLLAICKPGFCILTECTYIDDSKLATQNDHISYNDLSVVIERYPHFKWYLSHFSTRVTENEKRSLIGGNIHII
jgi:ribonuclease Z